MIHHFPLGAGVGRVEALAEFALEAMNESVRGGSEVEGSTCVGFSTINIARSLLRIANARGYANVGAAPGVGFSDASGLNHFPDTVHGNAKGVSGLEV